MSLSCFTLIRHYRTQPLHRLSKMNSEKREEMREEAELISKGKNWLGSEFISSSCSKNIGQAIVGSIVIALLVLANARVGDMLECINNITSAAASASIAMPHVKIIDGETPDCQSTFLDLEKREKLVICILTLPSLRTSSNITFSIGQSELIVLTDDDANRFMEWFRSCYRKDSKLCKTSRIIHPTSPYCVYNSTFEDNVTICFDSVKDLKEFRLRDYLFTEDQCYQIMEALMFAYKTR